MCGSESSFRDTLRLVSWALSKRGARAAQSIEVDRGPAPGSEIGRGSVCAGRDGGGAIHGK